MNHRHKHTKRNKRGYKPKQSRKRGGYGIPIRGPETSPEDERRQQKESVRAANEWKKHMERVAGYGTDNSRDRNMSYGHNPLHHGSKSRKSTCVVS
jgi:hypothetical protein